MPLVTRLAAKFYEHLLLLRAWVILAGTVLYLAASWLLFSAAGEEALVESFTTFLYFFATTASTVGYGDLSPETDAGRLVAALFFFPGAVTIFSVVLAKLTSTVVEGIRRMAEGKGDFSHTEGATILVGYHSSRTERMIEDLRAGHDDDHTIILLTQKADFSVPTDVHYVRTERLDLVEPLRRAGAENAAKVLVYADSDAETFNVCLAIREINPDVHVAAYFSDRETAARAEKFGNIEAVVSVSTEALVRAAQDPGTSLVIQRLSSSTIGSTVYTAVVEDGVCDVQKLRDSLFSAHATLIAIATTSTRDLQFAPYPETLGEGGTVFYIADKRLSESVWKTVQAGAL